MSFTSVQDLFDMAAESYGGYTAIARTDECITYLELKNRSNSLANFLIASGASRGSIVCVVAEDSITAIMAIIATLKAGCVFVPLDPDTPEKRLGAMIAEVTPQWILTEAKFAKVLSEVAANVSSTARLVAIDREPVSGTDHVKFIHAAWIYDPAMSARPAVASHPDDMCYIYFTSGSTGRPKGIAGRLKGIDHFIKWEINTLGLKAGVRVSHLLPISFDGSLRDIFVPLCAGGSVCTLKHRDLILDVRTLIGWIDDERINVIHCVPSILRSMLNEELNAEYFPALKYLLLAGEPLLPSDVDRWMRVYGERIQLINLYGTSETTMAKFVHFVRPSDKDLPSVPIGKPIEGAKALIVDETGAPCPQGMIGEIYIRTPYRSLGYYNQPELTKEVFIQNPFSGEPDDLIYKTGDIGRVLKDGNYEFLGRRDQQVKIRGVRVELAEIENVLRRHADVKDVAVIDQVTEDGYSYLSAFVVLSRPVEMAQLRTDLLKYLPDYMVPSVFVILETLPRTQNGKIDRRALLKLRSQPEKTEKTYIPPRTPIEAALEEIWTQLFGVEKVSIDDNFFLLGGHSLLATQLLSRVRRVLHVELPVRTLFEDPTIAGMALAIAQHQVEREDQEEIARIIEEIKNLSGDELAKALDAEMSSNDMANKV